MRLREALRIARGVVPGVGAPDISRLGKGLGHDTYRVTRDDRAFSVRISCAPRRTVPNEKWLRSVLELAAHHALSPRVVYGEPARGIIVQEWQEGRAWPASATLRHQNIERMAGLLRRVHMLKKPVPTRISSPSLWVRHYTRVLAGQTGRAAHSARRAADLAGAARRHLERLKALPHVAGVICHSDLHRLNVLEYRLPSTRRPELMLLDWEYAHVSEPFWDLAGWCANNDFPEGSVQRLLTAYLRRAPDENEWTRYRLLIWLYDYVCLLWSGLYLSSRHGGAAWAVEERAAVLHERLASSQD